MCSIMRISISPRLEINVAPGLYTFEDISANGKTYLRHRLEKFSNRIRMVLCCNERQVVSDPEAKLFMFDRADLYSGSQALEEAIRTASKDAIILMDLKDVPPKYRHARTAVIRYDKGTAAMEVVEG